MAVRFSAAVTPGAEQTARSASSLSVHERSVPQDHLASLHFHSDPLRVGLRIAYERLLMDGLRFI